MKFAIDLRVLFNKNRSGIENYTKNLVETLLGLSGENEEYFLLGDTSLLEGIKKKYYQMDAPSVSNIDISNKWLAYYGYLNEWDLFFSPYHPIPERRTFKGVLTIHDCVPLKLPKLIHNHSVFEFQNVYLRNSLNSISHVIVDSISTKNDVINYFNIDEEKITVIYLAGKRNKKLFSNNSFLKGKLNFNLEEPYILSVCTIEPRKNLKGTLKAYEILRDLNHEKIRLVLVGKLGWSYKEIIQLVKENKYYQDIIFTDYISDEYLPALYKNATMFIYPSLYEGFGLPVLEAMEFGCPVVTSNNSSLPEVGGGAVLYCDPYDIESITDAMNKVILSNELQNELRQKGLERSKIFSWEKTAKETRDVFLKVLNQ